MRFGGRQRAIVLGAGPAGLLAAHAAERRGMEVHVYSASDKNTGLPQKSELHGCQYLHSYIPDLGLDPVGAGVRYLLEGSHEDYRRKVYGNGWDGAVSPDEYGPEVNHLAWDLRQAYDTLWERWAERITPLELTPTMAEKTAATKGQQVFCTVPAKSLCLAPGQHKFVTQSVWAIGTQAVAWEGLSDRVTRPMPPYIAPPNTVQCNGNDGPRWYRAATVFGQSTLEWPAGAKPPISGVVAVQKPLSTDCDCHLNGRWHRLGRYGRWAKGVLVHEAYYEALVLR